MSSTAISISGGRDFYQRRAPGGDAFDLMVRDADGKVRTLVDLAALRKAKGGTPMAINYYAASPDGSRVAVGISEGGSENATLFIYDAATGAVSPASLPRIRFGPPIWSDDSRALYVNQLRETAPGAPPSDLYLNSTALVWVPGSAPVPLLGTSVAGAVAVKPAEFPVVTRIAGSPVKFALVINGVQNEVEIWTAPASAPDTAATPWVRLVTRDDGITAFEVRGDTIYLLSHKDAPTFKVLAVKAGAPLSSAVTVVAADPGRLIESIRAASDALYIFSREGLASRVDRIGADGRLAQVPLPAPGSLDGVGAFADPRAPGLTVAYESWTRPTSLLRYDPAAGKFSDLKLGAAPKTYDASAYAEQELMATAKDGTKVPLSVYGPKGLTGPRPVLLEAYGSYGVSDFPYFSARRVAASAEGITNAHCAVRGGGELGEAWRLGGKDANKPNTWRDLIACAETLIAMGITTPKMLFIVGGSAGGIPMGRAPQERLDLFAGVIDQVPMASAVRAEYQVNGPGNIPEFGTVKDKTGFTNLYAMDGYYHVEDGKPYPPYLITTGLNDPRVDPWQPSKLAARMRAANPNNVVLLRVEEAAGHGIGSTRAQGDGLAADYIAFIKWRLGTPGWTPTP